MGSVGKTAFVTGGTGFIGSHLVEALLERGYSEVRCLVRSAPKWLNGLPIVPIRATLMDQNTIEDAVRGVDYVYHLGGVTRARTFEALYEGNVAATLNLLNAVRVTNPDIKKVCVTSSLAVVGQAPATGKANESTPLQAISRYGRSKASMEHEVWQGFGSTLPIVMIRPSSVYGPRDRDIFVFFLSVRRGFCPILVGDAGLTLVHVSDLVRGIIDSTESERTRSETYFIGNDAPVTWQALRESVQKALGTRALTVPLPRILVMPIGAVSEFAGRMVGKYPPLNVEKAREILHAAKICSSAKARQDFGYEARMPLDEGVRQTIAWYRNRSEL